MSFANERAAARLRTALDLFVSGERMMKATLQRRYPEASDLEIEERFEAWLRERPGAEHGDAEGRPIEWPLVKCHGG